MREREQPVKFAHNKFSVYQVGLQLIDRDMESIQGDHSSSLHLLSNPTNIHQPLPQSDT